MSTQKKDTGSRGGLAFHAVILPRHEFNQSDANTALRENPMHGFARMLDRIPDPGHKVLMYWRHAMDTNGVIVTRMRRS